jgi:anti-anti-sigma factor
MAVAEDGGSGLATPYVEVELRPTSAPAFVAIVKLLGEHDVSTAHKIGVALAPIKGDLLVDLRECDFLDSSVIAVVVEAQQSLQREGHQLEVVVPPGTAVARTLELVGVSTVIRVRGSIDEI